MTDYKKYFQDGYERYIESKRSYYKDEDTFLEDFPSEYESKLIFVCQEVFGFTTYDPGIAYEIGAVIMETLDVIINRGYFKYIENRENYMKFIIGVDLLALKGVKLEWGTSIRGYWISEEEDLYVGLLRFVGRQ